MPACLGDWAFRARVPLQGTDSEMQGPFNFNLDFAQWATLASAVLGCLLALGVFLWGNNVFARRRSAAPEALLPPEPPAQKDPFLHGSGRERRQALRRLGNPMAVLISDAEAKASPWFGRGVDRSMGGLCVEVEEPIPEGTVLSVRAEKAVALLPW